MTWLSICLPTHPGTFDPAAFGYAETTQGRALIEGAITKVNVIINPDDNLQLVPGWERESWNSNSIPVHLIGGNTSALMIFVPQGCRCVVISVPPLVAWLANSSNPETADMAVDQGDALTFMMLHEIGHIAHGDNAGEAFAPLPTSASDANLVPTAEKTREFAADAWAADQVRHAFEPGQPGFSASMKVQLALSAMGWNLARRRLIDNFGVTALHDPRVIFDAGYTHPNFELRVLVSNELVSGSPAAKALREEFERMRKNPAD
ncbi:hypothetical protein E0H46_30435 [Rhizobium leguminosarum bv. viciae]|nr:hypothetical protein E0H46_30435 [Rhizobium leguminosarum bv. viciae]